MFSVNLYTLKICGLIFTLLAFIMVTAASTQVLAAQQRLMVYGDSLVAGYGLSAGEGFPEQLQQALTAAGRDVKVLNAGVSGDTTAGGLARLDWALSDQPDAVMIILGGNDLLQVFTGLLRVKTTQQIIAAQNYHHHIRLIAERPIKTSQATSCCITGNTCI